MRKQEFNIAPVAKPRMTKSDSWKKRPRVLKYWAFKDEIRRHGVTLPEAGSHVVFVLPMPKSWSAKKKAHHDCSKHQQTPDVDNLKKALLDSIFAQDCHIWDVRVSKIWGYSGKIIITDINEPHECFGIAMKRYNNRIAEDIF
jgi:hypothetical protein